MTPNNEGPFPSHPSRRTLRHICLAACLWGIAAHAAGQGSVASDREALVALYNATGGSNWTDNTNWLSSAPLGEWYGVETDGDGRVTGLDFARWDEALQEVFGNGLTGTLPSALGDLAHLRRLNIQTDPLTGPIPAELGKLAVLEFLDLTANGLTGSIPPELGALANLDRLDLRNNALSGSIPPELGDLANLEWLHLQNNLFTGEIPSALGNLSRLRALDLQCY